jgi:hypothetical protein
MENKYFLLGSGEDKSFVKLIRIIFGLVCIAVAVFWFVFNIKSSKVDGMLWITIIFLSGFGFYQVWAGLSRATRFIEISTVSIKLKKTVFLPALVIPVGEIQKIEVFPFNLIFFLKTGKKNVLRFSSIYHETNEKVKEEIFRFAEINFINIDNIEEKL